MAKAETLINIPEIRYIMEKVCFDNIAFELRHNNNTHSGSFLGSHYSAPTSHISAKLDSQLKDDEIFKNGDKGEISFSSHLIDGFCKIFCKFLGSVNSNNCFTMSYPSELKRYQRRINMRVQPLEKKPVQIRFNFNNSEIRENVLSLSAKGLGFANKNIGSVSPCNIKIQLIFPEGDFIERKGLLRPSKQENADYCYNSIVFTDTSLSKERRIRDYMKNIMS